MCALRESFVHFLNLDRQTRVLMNYAASDFETLSLNEQASSNKIAYKIIHKKCMTLCIERIDSVLLQSVFGYTVQ